VLITRKAPPRPPSAAPPPAGLTLPPFPQHAYTRAGASSAQALAASLHYGCRPWPNGLYWTGPWYISGSWYYVYTEDCRVPGYLLGVPAATFQKLQWIETFYRWNGYQLIYSGYTVNPEYSGTGGEIGSCFAGSCNGF
jgi:hypothetical protein